MEELHRIHKDVPFGYWVEWLQPAWNALVGRWREAHERRPLPGGLDQPSAPH